MDRVRDRRRPRQRACSGSRGRRGAWTLLTTLYELKGHEEPRGTAGRWAPSTARTRTARPGRSSAQREAARARLRRPSPTCWSSAAARAASRSARGCASSASRPSSSTSTPRPGDQWRNRYKSLCLHDPVWYDHLPYLKFPDNWPVFAPKDKIGDWLESYTKVMEVPTGRAPRPPARRTSEETGEWTVEVEREGQPLTLRPKQLVLRDRHVRQAEPARRSRAWTSSAATSTTRRRTPGRTRTPARSASSSAATTRAFDICGALWENDADVTMVQRSSTHIVKSDSADGHRARRPLLRARRSRPG